VEERKIRRGREEQKRERKYQGRKKEVEQERAK
jgi:hypothetical protein